jgi:hypothetical protein
MQQIAKFYNKPANRYLISGFVYSPNETRWTSLYSSLQKFDPLFPSIKVIPEVIKDSIHFFEDNPISDLLKLLQSGD